MTIASATSSESIRSLHAMPRELSPHDAMRKMLSNSVKAMAEHRVEAKTKTLAVWNAFVKMNEALPSIQDLLNPKRCDPVECIHVSAEKQGRRRTMEDAHFYKEIDEGVLVGLFDGHGGGEVAQYANQEFPKRFSTSLTQRKGNVYEAFDFLVDEIQKEVVAKKEWDPIGTTAVVCFIDKHTHLIYTLTLGDSEANNYRVFEGEIKSIALSCVRNWTSTKDALRASLALENPKIATTWPLCENPKKVRFPFFMGINVSRSIGDVYYKGTEDKPGLIHKPKITVNKVLPGDIVVIACDGLKDYVTEEQVINVIKSNDFSKLADALVDFAHDKQFSTDNISVVAVKIGQHTPQIRRFNPATDAETVLTIILDDLQNVCKSAYTKNQIDRWVTDFSVPLLNELATEADRTILVAVVNSKVVGTASLKGNSVQMVYVARNFQGKGIGRALMKTIENLAKDVFPKLSLKAAVNAVEFYQKLGYTSTGEEKSEEDGDSILMEKLL